ncbi:MAG: DedA family protein [Oscillospiraceae bacterium]|nr:DedA family protein [Oscillospiraceae bacterium]
MQEIIIEIMNKFGYIGVALLIMLENVFPPIPSEIILTFGGFMTTYADMNVWGVTLAATAGSLAGAVVLYIVGRMLTADRLERLITSKPGKLLRLKKGDVRRAERWFIKHGNRTVFFCRFIPIVRSLISIPAGAAKMKTGRFLALTAAGTFIWNVVLVFLGRVMGGAWETAAHYVDVYAMIAVAALGLIAAVVAVIFIKKRFLNQDGESESSSDEK